MEPNPLAGHLPEPSMLINTPAVVTAYYTGAPDPAVPEQRIAFGTSGHRGSSLKNSFNESHILAITQAICLYRKQKGIDGPLFIGMDTHALSTPAQATALEVLAANGVDVMVATGTEYTPTPAVSLAILRYNQGRTTGLSDGIIITPSHNPPDDGGFKYNPPNGGPAEPVITQWVEKTANGILEKGEAVARVTYEKALKASTTHPYDYLNAYVNDLGNVLDMDAIRSSTIHLGVDPLGGAGVHYWGPIAEKYGLKNLTVLNTTVDATFRFMTVDHDGKIRMDPSSPYAMKSLISVLPSTIYFNTGRVGEKRLRLEKRWSAVSLSTGLQPGWGGGSGRCRLVSNGLWMACWTEALDLSGRKAQARPFFVATVGCGRRIRTVLSLLCCRQRLWQEPAGTRVRYTTILPHSSASLATTALTPVQVPNKRDGWRRCLPNRSARNN